MGSRILYNIHALLRRPFHLPAGRGAPLLGLQQRELAARLGTSPALAYQIKAGRRALALEVSERLAPFTQQRTDDTANPLPACQWAVLRWTDRRREMKIRVQPGAAPDNGQAFVPDFSQPTYLTAVSRFVYRGERGRDAIFCVSTSCTRTWKLL